jgi:hypothetical protein
MTDFIKTLQPGLAKMSIFSTCISEMQGCAPGPEDLCYENTPAPESEPFDESPGPL